MSDYEVGYGKPPKHAQFKKGQSGNPSGRRKGSKNRKPSLTDEKLGAMYLAEATREIRARDGDREVSIPVFEAVIRSMAHDALKGDARARRHFLDSVAAAAAGLSQREREFLKAVIDYKTYWHDVLEYQRMHGIVAPEPVPHPDHLIIDPTNCEVILIGPLTHKEKRDYDWFHERRGIILAELDEVQSEIANTDDEEYKWHLRRDLDCARRMLAVFDKHLAKFTYPSPKDFR